MSELFISPKEYFKELVSVGLEQRKIKAPLAVQEYLVDLLHHYLDAKNLFSSDSEQASHPQTLAEMYLLAQQSPRNEKRLELLRRLGDKALYVSGYFGDSLQRKVVDIDYYIQMGGTAYGQLYTICKSEELGQVYWTLAHNFVDYVDVLTVVSHKSMLRSDKDLLRLYESYVKTGSELAKERLLELGLITPTDANIKQTKQS
ncbi:MAG: hypothetical protein ACLGGX_00745 [Bdellovibrionia bacterium]